jgi:muramoyltetrapeptide carboxypeptidase
MKQYPKWVVGFSDITVLHAALLKNELVSVHGSMAAAFNKEEKGEPYVKSLQAILEGKKNDIECDAHALNQKGIVTAPLVGGNLCLIAHLIGSSLQMDTKGKILFIEDIGETHYNVDRMLIQMKQAGMFHEVAGVIVGGFTDMKDKEDNFLGISINELIHSHLSNLQVPIAYGFPISHGLENYSVKEGATYRFEVNHDKVLLSAS